MPDGGQQTSLTDAELRGYLARALALIDALAADGISIDGCEDPAGFMCEVYERLGVDGADDPTRLALEAIRG